MTKSSMYCWACASPFNKETLTCGSCGCKQAFSKDEYFDFTTKELDVINKQDAEKIIREVENQYAEG